MLARPALVVVHLRDPPAEQPLPQSPDAEVASAQISVRKAPALKRTDTGSVQRHTSFVAVSGVLVGLLLRASVDRKQKCKLVSPTPTACPLLREGGSVATPAWPA